MEGKRKMKIFKKVLIWSHYVIAALLVLLLIQWLTPINIINNGILQKTLLYSSILLTTIVNILGIKRNINEF